MKTESTNNGKTFELRDGKWVEAKPLEYNPSLIERILDRSPKCVQRFMQKFILY